MSQPIKVDFCLNCACIFLFVALVRFPAILCPWLKLHFFFIIFFVIFHSLGKLRSSSLWKRLSSSSINEGVFYLKKNVRSSSIFHLVGLKQCCIPKISSLCCLEKNWGYHPFEKNWARLPLSKILRPSSIFYLVGSK